jgi:hypothetical protein
MQRSLGTAHRTLGLIAIALFFATGLLMCWHHVAQLPADSGLRMLFRSRHIYLLFSGLVNLSLGMGFVLPSTGRGSRIALAGSVLTLSAPVLLATAFFLEPVRSGQAGPVSTLGIFAAFIGVLSYSLGTWRQPRV